MRLRNKKYSLFTDLIYIHLITFALFLLIGFLFAGLVARLESGIYAEKRKREVGPYIERQQEQWLAWEYLGQKDIAASELAKASQQLGLESLRIITKDAVKDLDDKFVFITQLKEDLAEIPYVIEGRIPYGHETSLLLPLVLLGFFFLFTLAMFACCAFIVRSRVFRPLREFLGDPTGKRDIQASGEVLDLLDRFREMYDKVRESERSIVVARLTQMLAHDVRAPFEMTRALLKTLAQQTVHGQYDRALVTTKIEDIDRQIRRVHTMVEDVLELGRNTKNLDEHICVDKLVADCMSDLNVIYPQARVQIECDLIAGIQVKSHGEKLYRLFFNIMKNAFQAMGYQGQLWVVSSMRDPNWVEIIIRNSGSYISPEIATTIFDPLGSVYKPSGTGLGLAIAKKIVEEHGGKISCSSHQEMQMTSFAFLLPI